MALTIMAADNTAESPKVLPRLLVIGVGGAGGNAIAGLHELGLSGVDFAIADTDIQALSNHHVKNKLQLGQRTTRGSGAGSRPELGRQSAEESRAELEALVEGAQLVFLAAGLGGGTGTGALPVLVDICREREILTIGVATKPFEWENRHKMSIAEGAVEALLESMDILLVIPNQNVYRAIDTRRPFQEAMREIDKVLGLAVRGVVEIIVEPGYINLDFADIRTVMGFRGKALISQGEAEGEDCAVAAIEQALSNQMLEDVEVSKAKAMLVNITTHEGFLTSDIESIFSVIRDHFSREPIISHGIRFDDSMQGKTRVTIFATGIDDDEDNAASESANSDAFMSGRAVGKPDDRARPEALAEALEGAPESGGSAQWAAAPTHRESTDDLSSTGAAVAAENHEPTQPIAQPMGKPTGEPNVDAETKSPQAGHGMATSVEHSHANEPMGRHAGSSYRANQSAHQDSHAAASPSPLGRAQPHATPGVATPGATMPGTAPSTAPNPSPNPTLTPTPRTPTTAPMAMAASASRVTAPMPHGSVQHSSVQHGPMQHGNVALQHQPQPLPHSDSQSYSQPQAPFHHQPQAQPQTQPPVQPQAQPQTQPPAQSQAQIQAQPQAQTQHTSRQADISKVFKPQPSQRDSTPLPPPKRAKKSGMISNLSGLLFPSGFDDEDEDDMTHDLTDQASVQRRFTN